MNPWDSVKDQAAREGRPHDWPYIMKLYREIGGTEKSLQLVINQEKFELLGESDQHLPIVQSLVSNAVKEISEQEYASSYKMFKSINRRNNASLVPIKKMVTRKDGTSFMQTFYVSPEEKEEIESKTVLTENEAEKYVDNDDETFWKSRTAELSADIAVLWRGACNDLYKSKNLGGLAVREGIQNARDAINAAIKQGLIDKGEIRISHEGSSLVIEDNGVGMDTATLHKKFLTLGGTTKGDNQDNQSVGGFGQAKAVILGCGRDWEIQTRDNYFDSRNLGKGAIESTEFVQGTKITIHDVEVGRNWRTNEPIMLGDNESSMRNAVKSYINSSDMENIEVYYQGKLVNPVFIPGADNIKPLAAFNVKPPLEGTDMSISVFKKPEGVREEGNIYVRLKGLTQFVESISYGSPVDVVVDIDTTIDPRHSAYPFANNRETLKGEYENITRSIRDEVTKNPMSLTLDTKYRQTMFDNTSKLAEEQRKVSKVITTEDTDIRSTIADIKKLIEETNKIMEGVKKEEEPKTEAEKRAMEAEKNRLSYTAPQNTFGSSKPLSFADRINSRKQQIAKIAKIKDISEDEAAEIVDESAIENVLPGEDNPLDYAWLCWEKNDRKSEFHAEKHFDLLVAWDAICRAVLSSSRTAPEGFDFYPGFILDDEINGMSVGLPITRSNGITENRRFVTFNPEGVKTGSDFATARYLKTLACHELAHALLNNFEEHNEVYSGVRESLDRDSFDIEEEILSIVKKSKIRKKLETLQSKRVEAAKKELNDAKWAPMRKEFKEIGDKYEALASSQAMKEGAYLFLDTFYNNDRTGKYVPRVGETVRVFDPNVGAEIFNYYTLKAVNGKTATITPEYSYDEIDVPLSSIISSTAVEDLSSSIQSAAGYSRSWTSSHSTDQESEDWIHDNIESGYQSGVLAMVNKYQQSFHTRKKKYSDYQEPKERLKLVEGIVDMSIDNYLRHIPYEDRKANFTVDEYVENQCYDLLNIIGNSIKGANRNWFYDHWKGYGYLDIERDIKQRFKDKLAKSQEKPKTSNKAATGGKKGKKPKPDLSPEQHKMNSNIKSMNGAQLDDYASSIGVDLDTLRSKYPDKMIYRMRLTMAIKKKLNESGSYTVRG